VKKDKQVVWENAIDNHHELLEKYQIPDNQDNQSLMNFAKVEIIPPDNNPFKKDLTLWTFKVDERYIPDWFSPAHKEACYESLKSCLSGILLENQKIEGLRDQKGLFVNNCKINNLINSQIREMYDSQIEVMRDSQIGAMRDSSQIRVMYDSSQIRVMRDSSQIEVMYDSSKIGEMRDSSKIRVMYDSSKIRVMYDSSQIEVMRDSSQIEVMYDSSIILAVKSFKCKFAINDNAITICRYNEVEIHSKTAKLSQEGKNED